MNVEEAFKILDDLVFENQKEHLEFRDKAIVIGSLKGWTYQEIKENDPILSKLDNTVEFIKKCLAYKLWKRLTEILKQAGFLEEGEKIGKKNLWVYVERLQKSDSGEGIRPLIIRERYKIIKSLGSGEFSETYLAIDMDLPDNPECVVKRLPSESRETTKRFKREAQVLRQLGKHDQIPELFARFEKDEYFYLIHQFIEGKAISQELREGKPWQESQVIELIKEILEILVIVHQHDVIHRDINPEHLIRRASDGKIFLINFGSVKEINPDTDTTIIERRNRYMASEVFCGSPKCNSDIYAVGMISIQALTGLNPDKFSKSSTAEWLWRDRAEVSPQLADILDKMVGYDFRHRYQSATEVLQVMRLLH
ncbi:MAG: serine/threonine protein kinase [Symploca sp. SIO2E9]|nr:serine/threonine protein kinase [Symploca sp. SIO2E9]